MAELVDAQDLGSCVFDVGVRVPSRPLLFVTCRFCYTRYAREVWRRAGWCCCYLVIKSGLLVYMVTYPRLITDFDHKLLGSMAVNVPGPTQR